MARKKLVALDMSSAVAGQVPVVQSDGSLAPSTPAAIIPLGSGDTDATDPTQLGLVAPLHLADYTPPSGQQIALTFRSIVTLTGATTAAEIDLVDPEDAGTSLLDGGAVPVTVSGEIAPVAVVLPTPAPATVMVISKNRTGGATTSDRVFAASDIHVGYAPIP